MIKIDGITYKIRYAYKREDGTNWLVLANAEGLYGKYGDEWPVSQQLNFNSRHREKTRIL